MPSQFPSSTPDALKLATLFPPSLKIFIYWEMGKEAYQSAK